MTYEWSDWFFAWIRWFLWYTKISFWVWWDSTLWISKTFHQTYKQSMRASCSKEVNEGTSSYFKEPYVTLARNSERIFNPDIKSMRDSELHGSGLKLVNMKEGVQLAINRKVSGLRNVKCHIFIPLDAQLNIINPELESVTYWWNCHTLLIYKGTLLTEEQIKAHHNFFVRRYNIHWKSSHKKSTPWSMAWQENHSRELFKMIIFTLSSEIMSETLWISFTCEKFKFSWNQGCLQNVESCFPKSRLISRLIEIKVKFMSWLKIKVVFKTHQNPPFIQLSIKYNSKNKWAEKKCFFPMWPCFSTKVNPNLSPLLPFDVWFQSEILPFSAMVR